MPGIELSALNKAELLRLSEAARARGNGVLADRIDGELVARAGHRRQAAWPGLDLNAGPEPDDDGDAGPAAEAVEAEDVVTGGFEAEDRAPVFEPEPASRRGGYRIAAALLIGAVVGAAVTAAGFRALDGTGQRAAALEVTDAIPLPAPPAAALASLPAPSPALATPPAVEGPAPPRQRIARQARAASAAGTPAAAKAGGGCAGLATTAERLTCSDPEIARLARRTDEAHRRASLAAPADPRVTDETWWRRAREEAGNRVLLGQLYERRIRELDAVTADAQDEPIF